MCAKSVKNLQNNDKVCKKVSTKPKKYHICKM